MTKSTTVYSDATRLMRSATQAAATATMGAELAVASAQVIAARMAMMGAMEAVPSAATAGELARMVPEKAEAFTAAGLSMAGHLGSMAAKGAEAAARESSFAASACMDIASAKSPMDFVMAQHRYFTAFMGRATTQAVVMTALATRLQADALAPIHKTATANAKRLKV